MSQSFFSISSLWFSLEAVMFFHTGLPHRSDMYVPPTSTPPGRSVTQSPPSGARDLNREEAAGSGSEHSGFRRVDKHTHTHTRDRPLLRVYALIHTCPLAQTSWTQRGSAGGSHGRAHGVLAVTGGDLDAFSRGEYRRSTVRGGEALSCPPTSSSEAGACVKPQRPPGGRTDGRSGNGVLKITVKMWTWLELLFWSSTC